MIKNNQYIIDRFYPSDTVITATPTNTTTSGLTTSERLKLNSIQTGAEVNQYAFSFVKIPSGTISSISKTDTLNLVTTSPLSFSIDVNNNLILNFDTNVIPDLTTINNHIADTNVHHTHSNKNALDLLSVVNNKLCITGDMYATGEVSAYGAGTGSNGAVVELSQLTDVTDNLNPIDGDVLYYDSTLGKWKNIASSTLQTNLTGYATETYVVTQISNLVDQAPTTLNTLNELAAALGDDPNFATSTSNLIGTKWTRDNTKITHWDLAYSNNHIHLNTDALNLLSVVDGKLCISGDVYATGELSAFGAGSGFEGVATTLDELTDVIITNPIDSNLLQYDNGFWVNVPINSIKTDLTGYATENFVTTITNIKWTQDNTKITNWNTAYTNNHTHSNKSVLDGIDDNSVNAWDSALPASSYTASDVLAKLITVDGINSGLDADKLDGLESNRYVYGATSLGTTDATSSWSNIPARSGFFRLDPSLWINNGTGNTGINASSTISNYSTAFGGNVSSHRYFANYCNNSVWQTPVELYHSSNANTTTVPWTTNKLTIGSFTLEEVNGELVISKSGIVKVKINTDGIVSTGEMTAYTTN